MMNKNIYDVNTYDFDLPENLIAQTPLENRTQSKLIVYHKKTNTIEHKHFFDIIDYLSSGDVLVLNNTRVLPARLYGKKSDTNANIEILLHKRLSLNNWQVLAKPLKRLKVGTEIIFNDELKAIVKERIDTECIIEFIYEGVFETILEKIGEMPLPHYIHEKLEDNERYQTVYNKKLGSSAAPTAGFHFDDVLLKKIQDKGITIAYVTLDIGLGTFRPCSSDNILEHKMHTETYSVTQETADIINKAKAENRRVICVGTTSVRTIESVMQKYGKMVECQEDTSIFIYPGYNFKCVDCLVTNFHLPKSTLVMLVSAFCGLENTKQIYSEAIKNEYRFFSFGDSSFITD